jgi:chemotaxis protein histidine kinase CheA
MKSYYRHSLAYALVALVPCLATANEFASTLSTLTKEVQQALPETDAALKDKFIAATEAEFQAAQAAHKARLAATNKKVADKAAAQKASEEAAKAHEKAKADAQAAATALLAKLAPFLTSDQLDATLTKAALIAHATPDALAAFAQQGKENASLTKYLLENDELMKQMLVAGGAKYGKYGEAMRIYTAIQNASPKAKDGFLQTLALATALEHAEPVAQRNPADQPDAPSHVDPVKRYQHYEKAFLDGELDPDFKNLSVWELRMAVDCDAPDHILAWGREMMRNFRPDHMVTSNPGWRYTKLIKTDVLYGSKDQQFDLPSNQNYQNIVMNGGVCGRRAFVGRFLLCGFGIPTWGVTQKGHAAIGRWTPDGWVTNLGAGFQWSWWDKDETKRSGNDFLLETQARRDPSAYLSVLRAQWISRILGETAYNDRAGTNGGFWSNVAHHQSRAIAAALQAKDLGAIGEDLGESNESKSPDFIKKVEVTTADKQVTTADNGAITIPAVAFTTTAVKPSSFFPIVAPSGAKRLHCSRDMREEQSFEYTFEAPAAGTYQLTMQVVTVQANQTLSLTANGSSDATEIKLPYTVGLWQDTPPVTVALAKGTNTLRFTRPAGSRGLTISKLTLTPAP